MLAGKIWLGVLKAEDISRNALHPPYCQSPLERLRWWLEILSIGLAFSNKIVRFLKSGLISLLNLEIELQDFKPF